MKRSLTLCLTALVWFAAAPLAHADLDSLLGDWADATAAATNTLSDVSPAPVSAQSERTQARPRPQTTVNTTAVTDAVDERVPSTKRSSDNTLTGSYANDASVSTHPVALGQSTDSYPMGETVIDSDGYPEMISPPLSTASLHSNRSASGCGCPTGHCGGKACRSGGCDHGGCDQCGQMLAPGQGGRIEGQSECRPHRRPNLPPPSTFLQMFRSRNSYTDVWAGYADETRLRVRNTSPHLNGTWRCSGCGAMLEPGCDMCGCGCGH